MFYVRPVRGLGFRKGEHPSQTTWTVPVVMELQLFLATPAGKGVAASVAHVLVEQGELEYEQRVADVWPDFGAHGKDRVTVRDVLVHAAGVPGLWPDITHPDLGDWERVCAFLAGQRPWWEPGTETGYHALTFGYVLGEVVRRATGRTLTEALRGEIAAPLGDEDELHFGVPARFLSRVARQGPEGAGPHGPSQVRPRLAPSRWGFSRPPRSPTAPTSGALISPRRAR